jgi:hypothetical protein
MLEKFEDRNSQDWFDSTLDDLKNPNEIAENRWFDEKRDIVAHLMRGMEKIYDKKRIFAATIIKKLRERIDKNICLTLQQQRDLGEAIGNAAETIYKRQRGHSLLFEAPKNAIRLLRREENAFDDLIKSLQDGTRIFEKRGMDEIIEQEVRRLEELITDNVKLTKDDCDTCGSGSCSERKKT